MFQTCDPQGGASFDPRGIIWTILVEVNSEMLHTKYQRSAPSSFREDFQRFCFFFPFGCHGNQSYGWNSISWTTLVELYPRNITAKFHQDWPSGLEVVDYAQPMPDIGDFTKAHHEHFVLRWAKKGEIVQSEQFQLSPQRFLCKLYLKILILSHTSPGLKCLQYNTFENSGKWRKC